MYFNSYKYHNAASIIFIKDYKPVCVTFYLTTFYLTYIIYCLSMYDTKNIIRVIDSYGHCLLCPESKIMLINKRKHRKKLIK